MPNKKQFKWNVIMRVGDLVKYKFGNPRSKVYIVVTQEQDKAGDDKVYVTLYDWDKPNAVGLPQKFWVDHLEVISASR
jgi:hypothetical protein